MAFRVRSSKFRHVFGNAVKKEHCYDCIKITKNAHDSNYCAVNPKFVAVVTESAGGGAFLILPLERVRLKSYTHVFFDNDGKKITSRQSHLDLTKRIQTSENSKFQSF